MFVNDTKMDAKDISKLVRNYFNEVHGQYAVFGFRVETAEPLPKDGWKMVCSFLPTANASETQRMDYKIMISGTGEIKNVTRISKGLPPRRLATTPRPTSRIPPG